MCSGLRNKQYFFENQPCTKDQYLARLRQAELDSFRAVSEHKRRFRDMYAAATRLCIRRHGRVSGSSGDCLSDVENCLGCYEMVRGKDCRYVQCAYEVKDSQDCSYVMGELGYENCECFPQPFHSAFNTNCYTGNSLYYCDMCMNSCSDLFGCVGLRHASYCLLNKRYSRADYEKLAARVIAHMRETGEWGEFFPPENSPYGYNETNAIEEFPLSEEEAVRGGFSWRYKDAREYSRRKPDFPDNIANAGDWLSAEPLGCTGCGKDYRVLSQELNFYRRHGIPVPRLCPDCRHRERFEFRGRRRLFSRTCDACQKNILSTHEPGLPARILCEDCYLAEIG